MPQRWLDRRRRLRRYHVICVQTIGSSDTRELCACARCRWAVARRLLWQTPGVVGVHYNKPLDTKGVPAADVSARRARQAVTVCATYVGGRRDSVSAQSALCMLCEVSHNSSEVFTSRCQMLLGESASQGRVSRPPNRAFSHIDAPRDHGRWLRRHNPLRVAEAASRRASTLPRVLAARRSTCLHRPVDQ